MGIIESLVKYGKRLNVHHNRLTALEALVTAAEPKVYKALLSQAGTAAPVAIVQKNTLDGTLTWTRSAVGAYTLTSSVIDEFPDAKIFLFIGDGEALAAGDRNVIYRANNSSIDINSYVFNSAAPSFDAADDRIYLTSILIEVYP